MATLEKWACGFLPAIAAANVNAGAGSLACVGSVSLEQLVIDDDLYGHVRRLARGLDLTDEAIAEEVIEAVGPGRDFLLEDHTLAHFRTEHYSSPLASRLNAATWEAAGAVDVLERAAAAVSGILSKPVQPRLEAAQTREVGRLQVQAEVALRDLPVRI
jgi:trimethylamine--corrinoid protein Co-methyltransferase